MARDARWAGHDHRRDPVVPVCYEFQSKGTCHFGDTCKFSHEAPVKKDYCFDYSRGRCFRENCKFIHDER